MSDLLACLLAVYVYEISSAKESKKEQSAKQRKKTCRFVLLTESLFPLFLALVATILIFFFFYFFNDSLYSFPRDASLSLSFFFYEFMEIINFFTLSVLSVSLLPPSRCSPRLHIMRRRNNFCVHFSLILILSLALAHSVLRNK